MKAPHRKFALNWLGATALLAVLTGSAVAATGITATKHNLSSSSTTGAAASGSSDSTQICVFCHTPHGSDTSAPVPLWNKKLPVATTFTTYDTLNTSTLMGEVLAVGSVSLACLSCHDGAQAMDSVINAPGSGGYNANGARFGTWTAGTNGGALGIIGTAANPFPRLGTDLTNDHPIGIAYCGGGLTGSSTTVSGTCSNEDFIAGTSTTTSDGRTGVMVKTASINSNQVFWVDVDGSTGRGKADIQLYTRTFAAGASRPSVECGSCHDPHVESKGTDNMMFMRVTAAGSQICLSCHVK